MDDMQRNSSMKDARGGNDVGSSGGAATVMTVGTCGTLDADLLGAILEGLYVGRDNKALIVARNGAIVSLNPLAAHLCGYAPEALIGKSALSDLFDEPAGAPGEPAPALRRWEAVLRTASGADIPIEVVREPLGTRIDGALVYAVRDLRERRQAAAELDAKKRALEQRERELSIQNLRFDAAINNMPQGLAMLDAGGRLLVCNARFGVLYGIAPEHLQPGATLAEVLARSEVADDTALAVDADGSAQVHKRKDGRLLSITRRSMGDGGEVITTEDVTERERDKRRLEASNQELQSFAYVASHDLQEPLRKIETFADRLLSRHATTLPPEIATPLERIQDAARRMRRLITDLLAYARLAKEAPPFQRVSLNETLAGVLSDLQVRIEETGAQIHAGDLPSLDADPTQMRQLLQNLLSNALKFSRPGVAPVIHVEGEVRQRLGEGRMIALIVRDNGIGFDNRYKEQIFAIFQRLHGRSEYEGSGVGLATCRRIVERHQGSIDANGVPGEGATLTILLPVSQG